MSFNLAFWIINWMKSKNKQYWKTESLVLNSEKQQIFKLKNCFSQVWLHSESEVVPLTIFEFEGKKHVIQLLQPRCRLYLEACWSLMSPSMWNKVRQRVEACGGLWKLYVEVRYQQRLQWQILWLFFKQFLLHWPLRNHNENCGTFCNA